MMAYYDLLETPLGTLFIGRCAAGYSRLEFIEATGHTHTLESSLARLEREAGEPVRRDPEAVAEAVAQFTEYFAGARATFDLPLAAQGTPFQHEVWDALRTIPAGETRSYGQVAEAIGQPTASRAVGAANGQNPLIIVVPCHRVIGANGTLMGYGAGIERKRWLLDHEARWMPFFARQEAVSVRR